MLFQVRGAIPTTPWELVLTSSRETQFVLGVLAVFSLVSWYLIVLKWWQFRRMRQLADRFLAEVEKAMEAWLVVAREDGRPIPKPRYGSKDKPPGK